MAIGVLIYPPGFRVLDANGAPVSGAQLTIYEAGTTTETDSYSDSTLSTANTNPVVANAGGLFGPIYVPPGVPLKLALTDADDVEIVTQDNYYPPVLGVDIGTWTPALTGTTSESGQVYTTQSGDYIRSGGLVVCTGQIQLSTLGTLTGTVNISGLPFTVAGNVSAHGGFSIGQFAFFTTSIVALMGTLVNDTKTITMAKLTAAATITSGVVQADLSATSLIRFGCYYFTTD